MAARQCSERVSADLRFQVGKPIVYAAPGAAEPRPVDQGSALTTYAVKTRWGRRSYLGWSVRKADRCTIGPVPSLPTPGAYATDHGGQTRTIAVRIAGRGVRSGTVTVPQLHERDQTRNDGYPVGAPANPPRGLSIELRVPFQRPEYAERTNHPGWPL